MIEFTLPDMTCGHCASVVSKALVQADPACTIAIDLARQTVSVRSSEDRQTLHDALFEAGYAPA
jgi:copper chaperone